MPLGDSITVGSASGTVPVNNPDYYISYRKDLYDKLNNDGYSFNFVGSQTAGQAVFSDPQHEGHAGKTDDYVADNVYSWLAAKPAEIVLLHIGTNGLTESPTDVEEILLEIDRFEADTGKLVWVILARIINHITPSPTTTKFNDNVEDMALNRIALGDKIAIVDMENGAGIVYESYTSGGDMFDDIHPYQTGYTKMATVWKSGIDLVYGQACDIPPSIINPGDQVSAEGESIQLQIEAYDPNDQTLLFSQTGLPPDLDINPSTGLIEGTISYDAFNGEPYNVTVKVTDPDENAASVDFTWTVTNTNRPPAIESSGDQTSAEGGTITPLQIVAQDPDGDGITFDDNSTLPPGLSINVNSGVVSGSLGFDSAGSYPVTITVTEVGSPSPLSDIASFNWTITNTNRAPLLVNPGSQTNPELHDVYLQLLASDPDQDDSFTFSLGPVSLLPAGLQLDKNSGLISGIIAAGAAAKSPYPITVIAKDNGSPQMSSQVTFVWNVMPYYNPFEDPNTVFLPLVIH